VIGEALGERVVQVIEGVRHRWEEDWTCVFSTGAAGWKASRREELFSQSNTGIARKLKCTPTGAIGLTQLSR
jgi:hypothetical protein